MSRPAAVVPPATIGVLGGGQLGRYVVVAARTMGYRTVVLEPDPHAPAGAVADEHLVAAYDDPGALAVLAERCAVVTTEFENPPMEALAWLAGHTRVHPSPEAVGIAQDRRAEKRFLRDAGFPVGPFVVVETAADLTTAPTGPVILKTARLGYDGKGQRSVTGPAAVAAAWDELGRVPCVAEERLALRAEVSVVVARTASGAVAPFTATANTHRDGILELSVAPAPADLRGPASDLAVAVADALGYVGVLGVELFVVDGALLVNELAPRPHNSGHWTLDAARTSQFEQQVRAVCDLGLGDPAMTVPAVAMVNLLGDRWRDGEPDWASMLGEPGAHLHLYGKAAARPGRKMGHLTVTADAPDRAAAIARRLVGGSPPG